jgi:hypothetical protein
MKQSTQDRIDRDEELRRQLVGAANVELAWNFALVVGGAIFWLLGSYLGYYLRGEL